MVELFKPGGQKAEWREVGDLSGNIQIFQNREVARISVSRELANRRAYFWIATDSQASTYVYEYSIRFWLQGNLQLDLPMVFNWTANTNNIDKYYHAFTTTEFPYSAGHYRGENSILLKYFNGNAYVVNPFSCTVDCDAISIFFISSLINGAPGTTNYTKGFYLACYSEN